MPLRLDAQSPTASLVLLITPAAVDQMNCSSLYHVPGPAARKVPKFAEMPRSGTGNAGTGRLREPAGEEGEGEADYVGVVAVDAADEFGGEALDGVGAGFVERLAGGDVLVDFGGGEGAEPDFGFDYRRTGAVGGEQADAGEDAVHAAGEGAEHASGVARVPGLAEDLVADYYDCIGAEDPFAGVAAGGLGFGAGEAADVRSGGFAGERGFLHARGAGEEGDAGAAEDLAAARGLGCEDEAHARI